MALLCAVVLLVVVLLYKLLGPTIGLIWKYRRQLCETLWIRLRHPRVWREARDELRAAGELL